MVKLSHNRTLAVSAVAACVAVAAGVAGFLAGRYVADNRKPCFTNEYVLYVYPGTDAGTAIDSLMSGAGALRRGSLERCAAKEGLESGIKPGRYVIEPSFTAVYAVRMLVHGWQTPQNMTLSGTIRSMGSLARKIGMQMMVDSAQVAQALCDTAFLARYGYAPENIFAMILPDTYQMYWTASVKDIFDRLSKEHDIYWTDSRKDAAEAQGLSPYEATVLASIVSGETLKPFEYPEIAGVYLNRLHRGMKLQADPTVAFCYGYTLDRILRKHLKVDSPYNTYKYKGLPPAPINVPPKACIEAVLHPDRHGYLYFCASPAFDGTHRFAVTYKEHLKNAREFQRALTQRQREKAAAAR